MKHLKIKINFLILLVFLSCSKEGLDTSEEGNNSGNEDTKITYETSKKYSLNVVYFTPSDNGPKPKYEERISNIMIKTQDYVDRWMRHWGYENSKFGLEVNPKNQRVKIVHIEGKLTKDIYPYDRGWEKIIPEIEAFYKSNKEGLKPTSDHYLVILPDAREGDDIGGVPFYGLGRYCFVLDAGEDMAWDKIGTSGQPGKEAGWIGGLIHELGHGLNLPHNSQKRSEVTSMGTALMDSGNHVISDDKINETFITAASAAILSESQVFSNSEKEWHKEIDYKLTRLQANFAGGNLELTGDFTSSVQVNKVIVNQDPSGRDDYNQIGWVTNLNGNSFTVSMPAAELRDTKNREYDLNVMFVFDNGLIRKKNIQGYKYENDVTDLFINYQEKETKDRSSWSVISFSSQETQYGNDNAAVILDGDISSFWHSGWSNPAPNADHPHHLTVDMGEQETIDGFQFTQRQSLQRNIKDLSIQISVNVTDWEDLGNFRLQKATFPQNVDIPNKTFRYFKLTTVSDWDNSKAAALAEVDAY